MKSPAILSALLLGLGASNASATVNLVFGGPTIHASNWANGAGVGGSTLVWGVVIDADGDGFDANGVGYRFNTLLTAGQHNLICGDDSASDDVLYISSATMSLVPNTNDGATMDLNRIVAISNMPMTGNAGTGDSFAIIWFDETALGGVTFYGEEYGLLTNAGFTLPNDFSSFSYTSPFSGPDSLKQMNYTWIAPEPSSLLLSLVGAVGLLRRRR